MAGHLPDALVVEHLRRRLPLATDTKDNNDLSALEQRLGSYISPRFQPPHELIDKAAQTGRQCKDISGLFKQRDTIQGVPTPIAH
jgi:hypothetical protein